VLTGCTYDEIDTCILYSISTDAVMFDRYCQLVACRSAMSYYLHYFVYLFVSFNVF